MVLRHHLVTIALLFATLAAPAQVQAAAPKPGAIAVAQKLAAEAKAAYIARDYDKAALLYAEALKNFDHEDLWFTYARSLEQGGQFKTAAMAYGRAGALMPARTERTTIAARGVANAKLDEAQQLLTDGQPAQAQTLARAAHAVLYAHSRRAEDGKVYPEPASVLLLLARLELAQGNQAVAQQMPGEIRGDPTAPPKVLERAAQLASASAHASAPASAPVPAPAPAPAPAVAPATPPESTTSAPAPSPDRVGAGLRARPASGPADPKRLDPTITTQPAKTKLLLRWIALGSSAAVALTGAAWLGISASEKSAIQSKIDAASASGKSVDGLSQTDYAAAKTRLDRNYFASSVMLGAGGVGIAASALWLWLGPDNNVAVVPQLNGASVVVAW